MRLMGNKFFQIATATLMPTALITLLVSGCFSGTPEANASPPNPFYMRCIYAGNLYIYRCENQEILCYIKADAGMQCKWKEPK